MNKKIDSTDLALSFVKFAVTGIIGFICGFLIRSVL